MARGKKQLLGQASRDLPLSGARAPQFKTVAKYAYHCPECETMIHVGDEISMIKRGSAKLWRHATCALPSGPGTTPGAT